MSAPRQQMTELEIWLAKFEMFRKSVSQFKEVLLSFQEAGWPTVFQDVFSIQLESDVATPNTAADRADEKKSADDGKPKETAAHPADSKKQADTNPKTNSQQLLSFYQEAFRQNHFSMALLRRIFIQPFVLSQDLYVWCNKIATLVINKGKKRGAEEKTPSVDDMMPLLDYVMKCLPHEKDQLLRFVNNLDDLGNIYQSIKIDPERSKRFDLHTAHIQLQQAKKRGEESKNGRAAEIEFSITFFKSGVRSVFPPEAKNEAPSEIMSECVRLVKTFQREYKNVRNENSLLDQTQMEFATLDWIEKQKAELKIHLPGDKESEKAKAARLAHQKEISLKRFAWDTISNEINDHIKNLFLKQSQASKMPTLSAWIASQQEGCKAAKKPLKILSSMQQELKDSELINGWQQSLAVAVDVPLAFPLQINEPDLNAMFLLVKKVKENSKKLDDIIKKLNKIDEDYRESLAGDIVEKLNAELVSNKHLVIPDEFKRPLLADGMGNLGCAQYIVKYWQENKANQENPICKLFEKDSLKLPLEKFHKWDEIRKTTLNNDAMPLLSRVRQFVQKLENEKKLFEKQRGLAQAILHALTGTLAFNTKGTAATKAAKALFQRAAQLARSASLTLAPQPMMTADGKHMVNGGGRRH